MNRVIFVPVLCAIALSGAACVRIPAEALQVNGMLHTNIADAQKKHEDLVDAFFAARKDQLDDFFLHTYEPAYLKNFKTAWDKKNPSDLFDISKPAHRAEYEQNVIAKYQELVGQIDTTQTDFKKQLDQAYGNMLQENDAVGKLLKSAKDVSDADKKAWNTLFPKLSTTAIDARLQSLKDELTTAIAQGGDQSATQKVATK